MPDIANDAAWIMRHAAPMASGLHKMKSAVQLNTGVTLTCDEAESILACIAVLRGPAIPTTDGGAS